MNRRTFLLGNIAVATGGVALQGPRLETLSQWLRASRAARDAALQPLVERIRDLDAGIHAWVQVLPQNPTGTGPLGGIPFGVKDIIETKGLATEYGSPIYKGRIGTADAAIVGQLRQRGGVLLGKTHTTSFAYITPAPTRNPRNLAHTPGGSSSGSAAAVAAGMVPVALGTQTGGSVVRPASFCGVAGFKASYGLISTDGVLPFAKSLDTLGFFTHSAADMLALWELLGWSTGRTEDFPLAMPDPMPEVEPAMAIAFRDALERLRRAGLTIRAVDITAMLRRLRDAQRTVMFYEGARFHEERYKQYGDRLADMGNLVRDGLQIPVDRYDEARKYIAECQRKMAELFKATPVILTPAAPGPAPQGLASTGDSRLNAPWTALGTPAITIPMPVGSALPLGLQLTADHGQDARIIRTAMKLEALLSSQAGGLVQAGSMASADAARGASSHFFAPAALDVTCTTVACSVPALSW
jgi:Asp-tRNA(Asn)/Glu-tRNA(Gln) amidotransferase A subunit family amidase